MNWATIEHVAKNADKQWYLNQKEVAQLLGRSRWLASEFLQVNSVPYYRIGKEKKYFLPEVLEAADKQKWK